MQTFNIDPEYTLKLAHELEAQSRPHTVAPPPVPGGPVAEFCAALKSAHEALTARNERLRADLAELADLAVVTAHASTTVDGNTSNSFNAKL